jgi:uncharacterized protein YecT (DUF1311 family)
MTQLPLHVARPARATARSALLAIAALLLASGVIGCSPSSSPTPPTGNVAAAPPVAVAPAPSTAHAPAPAAPVARATPAAKSNDDPQASDDPIDRALEACIEAAGVIDANYAACQYEAMDAWDRRLNKAYARLESLLQPADYVLVREAQRHWLAFVEADEKARRQLGGDMGTLDGALFASAREDRVRARALELEALVDEFAPSSP